MWLFTLIVANPYQGGVRTYTAFTMAGVPDLFPTPIQKEKKQFGYTKLKSNS